MAKTMNIGSPTHWIRFERESSSSELMLVKVAAGQASAQASIAFFASDFVGFLKTLSESWKGWRGVKTFETLDSDFTVNATHDGVGEITFDVDFLSQTEDWRFRASIPVEPGSLSGLLTQAEDTLSGIPKTASAK